MLNYVYMYMRVRMAYGVWQWLLMTPDSGSRYR